MKRNSRLIAMTQYLASNPHKLISLSYFSDLFDAAKSTISEDLTIINEVFIETQIGIVETVFGAAGGARYIPYLAKEQAKTLLEELGEHLTSSDRVLPGGYIYLSDVLGDPQMLQQIGLLLASYYARSGADVIMTTATKGVPIAQAVSAYLNIPFVIVRRDSKITEGSTVSINYHAKSANRVEKMELSRRSLREGSKVLIVDDFMNGGGTFKGMNSLVEEFKSETIGAAVFCENTMSIDKQVSNYISLFKVNEIDTASNTLVLEPGSILVDYPEL